MKDQTGAVIPGATVTIRSEAINVERKATTSGEGFYSIPQLRPSAYTMTVEATNFGKVEVKELVLGVGQTRSLDVELKAGNVVGEAVNIVASDSPATIDTSSNRLGVNVTEREVKELPVNGRNFSQLQLLTPGATNTGTGNFNEVRFNSRSNEQNQTRLDGIESTAIWDASPGYLTVKARNSACRPRLKIFRSSASTRRTTRPNTARARAARSTSSANRAATTSTARSSNTSATTRSTRATSSTAPISRSSASTSSAAAWADRSSKTGSSSSAATRACASVLASTLSS